MINNLPTFFNCLLILVNFSFSLKKLYEYPTENNYGRPPRGREQIARISGSQTVAVIGLDLSSMKHVQK